jgi:hypothetical protein
VSLLLLLGAANPPPGTSTTQPYAQVLLETDPGVFVDVSADLRAGVINRGRQAELDRYQAGTCSLDLDNADRAYDPTEHTYIKPGKRLAVFGSYAGTTWPQFTGKVDGWAERSNGPNDATATLAATDAFKDMAKADLPPSSYVLEVLADTPAAWWRLGEGEDAPIAYDAVGTADLDVLRDGTGVGADFETAGLISRDPDTALTVTDLAGAATGAQRTGGVLTTAPLTLETIYQGTDTDGILVGQLSADQTEGSMLTVGITAPNGKVRFWACTSAGCVYVESTVAVNDGSTHHIAGTWAADGTLRVYVDGVDVTTTPNTRDVATFVKTHVIFLGGGVTDTILDSLTGVHDEPAIYATALSAARVAAHAEARSTPWNNDTPGERMGRLLDYLAIPEDLRDLDPGSSVLQSATLGGSVLEHAQKVGESEFGFFYITAAGVVRLEDRHSTLNQTPAATISDQPAAPIVYRDSTPRYDDTLIRNEVTISRSEGVAQTVRDEASADPVTGYGRHSFTLDGLLHNSDELSRDAGQFILAEYAQPKRRITDLTVGPPPSGKEAAMYPQMLGRELTDWVTVTEWPQGVGSVITQVSMIEGVNQTFGPKHWQTKWQLSPARSSPHWQIGRPGYSEIGLTTKVGF